MTTEARRVAFAVILVLLVALSLGSCAPKMAERAAMSPTAAPPAADEASATGAAAPGAPLTKEASDSLAGGGDSDKPVSTTSPGQRRIITTGSMTIEVISLDQAMGALTALVSANGAFFANKSISAEGNWRHASLTIRVPASKFDALHEGARGLGVVKSEDQQGEDVTKQWQDLEARLRIRKQEEQSLVQLMQKQARLSDLLDVEKRLWEVREQIEQSEGELRYLRDQVTLATLTLTLNEQVPVGVERIGRWNLGYHLLQAVYAMGRMMRGLVIGLIYVALPGAVIWVPLLLVVLWIRRRVRAARARRAAAAPPPPASQ
jgi:hypothetical protein